MLGFIKRLLGAAEGSALAAPETRTEPATASATPLLANDSPAATLPSNEPSTDNDRSFICRAPLIDRHERIAGYEFSLKRNLQNRLQGRSTAARRAYDEVLLKSLVTAHAGQTGPLPGQGLAFIDISPQSLTNPLLDALPAQRSVLMLDSRTSAGLPADELEPLGARLAALQARGLRHGWRLYEIAPLPEVLMVASNFIQITPGAAAQPDNAWPARLRQSARPNQPLQLIAHELQTHADFDACRDAGYDFFHGPFITDRAHWQAPRSDINRLRVIELLNLIRSGGAFAEIAECLKTEPVLTFKLLRYINSPALGLQREILNLAQGLVVLGRDKFYRWLSLLLFDSRAPGYRERMLTEQALTRAHFLEGLAGQGRIPATPDPLFMTGTFSLLDTLMGKPMADMLGQVALPEAVRAALLGEDNIYRTALELIRALENHDDDQIARTTDQCGLNDASVTQTMLEALAWAQSINSTSAEPKA